MVARFVAAVRSKTDVDAPRPPEARTTPRTFRSNTRGNSTSVFAIIDASAPSRYSQHDAREYSFRVRRKVIVLCQLLFCKQTLKMFVVQVAALRQRINIALSLNDRREFCSLSVSRCSTSGFRMTSRCRCQEFPAGKRVHQVAAHPQVCLRPFNASLQFFKWRGLK